MTRPETGRDTALWRLCHRAIYSASIKEAPAHVKADAKAFLDAMAGYAAAPMMGLPAQRWRDAAVAASTRAEEAIARYIANTNASEVEYHGDERVRGALLVLWAQVTRWPGPSSSLSETEPELLPTVRVADLKALESQSRWLIETLWGDAAVGIIGGHPKSKKTFLALEMAVAVASGTPCLGRFKTEQGSILAFIGEGKEEDIWERVALLSASRGIDPSSLPIESIRLPRLLLDSERDAWRLSQTIAAKAPKLLILDPFVRLHTGDENDAGHVSRILGYLRGLQREFGVAIILVHHFKKSFSSKAVDGLGLRGSGDLHAWGDSNLYLHRTRDRTEMHVEHRAAAVEGPWELVAESSPFALTATEIKEEGDDSQPLTEQVIEYLSVSGAPQIRPVIRSALKVRNEDLGAAINELVAAGKVLRGDDGGYALADTRDDAQV